jgi:hypothetical protein
LLVLHDWDEHKKVFMFGMGPTARLISGFSLHDSPLRSFGLLAALSVQLAGQLITRFR